MKTILFAFLFIFIPKLTIAQIDITKKDITIYLDSTWNKTKSENYTYYRIIKDYYLNKNLYVIKD